MSVLPAIFAGSFVVALSGAVAPGPVLTASIDLSARRGFMAGGPRLMLGHGLLEIALLCLLFLGLAPYLLQDQIFASLSLVGAFVLLWMGYGLLKSLKSLNLEFETSQSHDRALPEWRGAALSLANPYWILWWATIGLSYLSRSLEAGILGVVIFYVGHILGDAAWYCFVAFGVSKGRNLFTLKFYRALTALLGVFLIGLGLYFGVTGGMKFGVI